MASEMLMNPGWVTFGGGGGGGDGCNRTPIRSIILNCRSPEVIADSRVDSPREVDTVGS